MKIVVMGNNALMSGLTVHYIVLCRYLRKAGHQLLLINLNDDEAKIFDVKEITEFSIPFKPNSIFSKINKYFRIKKACKIAKAFEPNLFIATGYGNGYCMVASALNDSTFKFFQEVHFDPKNVALKIKMVHIYDATATQTQGMVEVFKKNISNKKPVSYLPCFSKEYKLNKIHPINYAEPPIRLVYFGRLEWNKGIKQFIEATYQIFKNKSLNLEIYGKGSEENAIKKLIANKGLQDKIFVNGFYEDEEFENIINNCHGVIIPSVDTEGLPLVVIEAMRYGRPILCTDIGAMPEVAEINYKGMVVSGSRSQQLVENLKLFLNRIEQKAFSAEEIHNIYSAHYSNSAFWEVWQQMLNNPHGFFYN